MNEPRLILVCCEGKSEEAYFNTLVRVRRVNNAIVPPVKSYDGSQHTRLIDICVEEREELSREQEVSVDDIEVWAVCDKDSWSSGYAQLKRYADEKSVQLAYSDPQFESYLLQHFAQSSFSGSGTSLEQHLSDMLRQNGYDDYIKGDLSWFEDAIDVKPSIVEMAIVNGGLRNRRRHLPFLTVQSLTSRLLEFELK